MSWQKKRGSDKKMVIREDEIEYRRLKYIKGILERDEEKTKENLK